eukprot:751172-Hanusia_phi.AAC.1
MLVTATLLDIHRSDCFRGCKPILESLSGARTKYSQSRPEFSCLIYKQNSSKFGWMSTLSLGFTYPSGTWCVQVQITCLMVASGTGKEK